jgi:hypothetical protein
VVPTRQRQCIGSWAWILGIFSPALDTATTCWQRCATVTTGTCRKSIEKISLQNHNVLLSLADWWNEQALGSNEIYNKYPEHLALHYKKWRKSQSAKEALRQPDIQEMIDTLENAAGGTICPEITERRPLRTAGTIPPMPSTSDTSKKRTRKCKVDGCPDPENCSGKSKKYYTIF